MRKVKLLGLVDVLAGIALLGLVLALAYPMLQMTLRRRRAIACRVNLTAVRWAVDLWISPNGPNIGFAPWIDDACDNSPAAMLPGGADTLAELYVAGKYENILENLNVLVDDGSLSYESFLCPASGTPLAERTGANRKYGFFMYPDGDRGKTPYYPIDYGYHLGCGNLSDGATPNPAAFSGLAGDFAIMADADVGDKKKADRAWNHGTEGVNVLRYDGSVKWVAPDASGCIVVNGDNIYTSGGAADTSGLPDADPADPCDQVIYSPL